jgi:hypothetical protein
MADHAGKFTSISVIYEMRDTLPELKQDGETYSDLLWSTMNQHDPTK